MSELVFVARWEYQDAEFQHMISDVDTAKTKVHDASADMGRDYLRVAGNVAHLGTAFLGLEGIISRVSEGQMGLGEATLRLIPTLVSLASAVWALVTAEKARAIASGIATAVSTMGASMPITVAAATAAGLALTAILASIPEHHYEGVIQQPGIYKLAAGQPIGAPGAGSLTSNDFVINVYGGSDGHKIGRDIIEELRVGGFI